LRQRLAKLQEAATQAQTIADCKERLISLVREALIGEVS
jgi:hypothetical protein